LAALRKHGVYCCPRRQSGGHSSWAVLTNSLLRAPSSPGRLNQAEYQERIDSILNTPEKDHLHNQLLAALYGNVTREMPDPDLAPWVSANDKPAAPPAPKPVTGDAAERRLKGEVMQLPSRDRRRIKDLVHNNVSATAPDSPPSPRVPSQGGH
jgi:transcriptional coactivator HFI1/ADA1